jgi:hypothetical protein
MRDSSVDNNRSTEDHVRGDIMVDEEDVEEQRTEVHGANGTNDQEDQTDQWV